MEDAHLNNDSLKIIDPTRDAEPRLAAGRIARELTSVKDEDITQINVEVDAAVTHVLGYWKTVEPLLPVITKLPMFDASRVANLRDYALALHYWHSLAQFAAAPPAGLAAKVEKGIALRDRVLSMLKALAKFGVLDEGALESFGGTTGYRKVARDLTALSGFVHERWGVLSGKSMISLAEMDEAERLGFEILEAIGDRDASPAAQAHAVRERDKTFTLFARAHDQARRAILFLRWDQGDADTIMPSIYAGRVSKKREGESELPKPTTPQVPTPPVASKLGAQTSSLLVDESETEDRA